MRMTMMVVMLLATAGPALAQGPYVAATIGGDIVKSTTFTAPGTSSDGGSGQALSGALRVGGSIAPRFGVELEWVRAGEIQADETGPIYYATDAQRAAVAGAVGVPAIADVGILPIISQQTRIRTATLSALAFARQPVGARVELVYLGGIGFSRMTQTITFGVPGRALPAGRGQASYTTATTQYGQGPVVGFEARVGMTEHARLIAGVRLQGLGQSLVDGWVIRPGVGLGWSF
jgi:hypothetical protein